MINVEKVKPTGLFTNYIYKAIPLAFDESMSYYETLCGLLSYLKDTVIPTLNNNADAIIEVQNLMTQLQDYVDNYFENLDVQEEINNKLDEMAEHGELTDIIAQYLQLAGVLAFNNVNELKNAENITNGSIVSTLGFYEINDGGNAYYKIREVTNQDVIDESSLIALQNINLVAELICHEVNLATFGCYGDNVHDDTSKMIIAINYAKNKNLKVTSPKNKTYIINQTIDCSNLFIDLNDSILKTTSEIHMIQLNETDSYKNGHFQNIVFDCNNIALTGINIINTRRCRFNNLNFINIKNVGIDLHAGYENMFDLINMQSIDLNNTSNIGIKVQTRDCNFNNITMANICNPFYLKATYGNYFNQIHTWIGQSALIEYSTLFVIDLTYPEPLFLNDIYDDTMRYLIKYTENSAEISHGYINNLIVENNLSIYTKDLDDSILFYCYNDNQTKNINITNSTINGLYYTDHQSTDAKTLITNRNDFLGNIEDTFYSSIGYTNIKTLNEVNQNITLTINNIYKSNKTIYLNIVGYYESNSISGNVQLGKIPNELMPKSPITSYCMVTDSRWDYVTPTPYYMYIPQKDSNENIQLRLPSGTGRKFIFITLCYNKD